MSDFGIIGDTVIPFNKADIIEKDALLFAGNVNELVKRQGSGTYIDLEKFQLKSGITGYKRVINNKIYIDILKIINGNFDQRFQEKYFDYSLLIKGDILTGADFFVNGNLQVEGTVENCNIRCMGNIIIKGNFYGLNRAKIRAKGDVYIKEINSASVIARNILIGESVRFSNIIAKGSVIVKGKGEIVGGKIFAKDKILASVAGSKSFTKTLLSVGYDYEVKSLIDNLKNRLDLKRNIINRNREDIEKYFSDISLTSEDDYIDFIIRGYVQNDMINLYTFKALENIKLLEEVAKLKRLINRFKLKRFSNPEPFITLKDMFPGVELMVKDKKILNEES